VTESEHESAERAELSTGHVQVDEVLQSMADLADRPLDEHVAVFEQAHQTLRSALSDAASAPRGPQPGA